jgi:hypothetical protein
MAPSSLSKPILLKTLKHAVYVLRIAAGPLPVVKLAPSLALPGFANIKHAILTNQAISC